jgi:signal peptidase I
MPENIASDGIVIKDVRKNRKTFFLAEIYEWVGIASFVFVIFVLLFSFVFREVYVYGDSMLNTLHNGDRLIICGINYKPRCDDIVVIYAKNLRQPIVKRVIAIGGQTVNIDYAAHRVYVDGILKYEPFIKEPTAFAGEEPIVDMPVTVPKNYVFVMGDNRNNSKDSRSGEIGMISTKYIIGKALLRYFPVRNIKFLSSN